MTRLAKKVQVNIPFTMLHESYLDRFLRYGLNPEIGIDAVALDRYTFSEFQEVAEPLREHDLNVTLHAPFMDMSPGSPDAKVWALTKTRFEEVLQLVPLFRPQTIVCHAGYDEKRYGFLRETWAEKSLEMWGWLAGCLREAGVALMLENVYEHGPEQIRFLFEHLQSQGVGFCLDAGHQAAFGRAPLETWLDALGKFIGQLHLHDNRGERDEHQAMGRGTVDFKTLFNRLASIRKSPPVITLEPHSEANLWPSLEYLESIWPW